MTRPKFNYSKRLFLTMKWRKVVLSPTLEHSSRLANGQSSALLDPFSALMLKLPHTAL